MAEYNAMKKFVLINQLNCPTLPVVTVLKTWKLNSILFRMCSFDQIFFRSMFHQGYGTALLRIPLRF